MTTEKFGQQSIFSNTAVKNKGTTEASPRLSLKQTKQYEDRKMIDEAFLEDADALFDYIKIKVEIQSVQLSANSDEMS